MVPNKRQVAAFRCFMDVGFALDARGGGSLQLLQFLQLLHGRMHGKILQENRVSNGSVRGKQHMTWTSCCAVSTAAAAAGMACSNGGARVRKRDMQALRVVQWYAVK